MTANRVAAATNAGPPIVTRTRGDASGDAALTVLATWAGGVETDISITNPLPAGISDGTNILGTVAHPVQTADAAATAALGGLATQTTLASVLAAIQAAALPSGASTAAKQDIGNTSLAGILSGLASLATATAQATAQTTLSSILTALGPLASQTTVAAILSALQGALTVNLPSGAATSAAQGAGNASLASIDGKVTVCNTGAVTVSTCALPTGAATVAAQTNGNNSLSSLDGKVTACNTGAVVVTTCALPSGASTSALQTSGNASLTSIDGKTPALGQALAAASSPVVLTVAQDVVAYGPAKESGGHLATIDTSTASTATSSATTATNTGTTATNTATIATTLSSILAKFTDGLQRAGILGTNGSAIASATNPVDVRPSADGTNPVDATHGLYVRPGTSTLWDVIDRAARLVGAISGSNGTAVASPSNPLDVQPGTSVTWNVSDRAARLLGALTGINGSGVATGANPVPVQLSDGSAIFTGAKETGGNLATIAGAVSASRMSVTDTRLPAAFGAQAQASCLPVTYPKWVVSAFSSFATAGVTVVSGAGYYRSSQFVNNTGTSVIPQGHNSGLPSNGAVPLIAGNTLATGGVGVLTPLGEAALFMSTDVTVVASTTATTFAAGASTALTGFHATS